MNRVGAALYLRGVSFVRDGRTILAPLDWAVETGERWLVLGANGSGKTTIVRIAALYDGLAQLAPSPVVELNRAVAVAMAFGPAAGLAIVDELAASRETPPAAGG